MKSQHTKSYSVSPSYWCAVFIVVFLLVFAEESMHEYDTKPRIDSNLQKWFFYEYILQKRLSGF